MKTNRSSSLRIEALIVAAISLCSLNARSAIQGPYTADANTLQLWHLDDSDVPVLNSASGGTNLATLGNGATLGNASYTGFGTALSTAAGSGAYLAGQPLVNGVGDEIHMAYANATTGAFTYEALLRVDFNPATFTSTQPLYIMAAENDATGNRPWQFAILPNGVAGTTFRLRLFNSNGNQSFTTAIPTTGPDALAQDSWYHVAVSYDGNGDAREYWTLLDPSRTEANQIGTFALNGLNPLAEGDVDFTIGNVGRTTPNGSFPGLIDEVRISDIARGPDQFIFAVPEPSTYALMSLGGLACILWKRRRG